MFKDAKSLYYSVAALGGLFLIVIGLVTALHAGTSYFLQREPREAMMMGIDSMPPVPYEGVAKGVEDGFALVDLEGLENVGVGTDDNLGTCINQTMSKLDLFLAGAGQILGPPVKREHQDVYLGRGGSN